MFKLPPFSINILILFVSIQFSGCTSVAYKTVLKECAHVYGNWCGENYPLTGYNPSTVDSWDSACRSHDQCYDSVESKSSCDRGVES